MDEFVSTLQISKEEGLPIHAARSVIFTSTKMSAASGLSVLGYAASLCGCDLVDLCGNIVAIVSLSRSLSHARPIFPRPILQACVRA